jgi:hypothetical protein
VLHPSLGGMHLLTNYFGWQRKNPKSVTAQEVDVTRLRSITRPVLRVYV